MKIINDFVTTKHHSKHFLVEKFDPVVIHVSISCCNTQMKQNIARGCSGPGQYPRADWGVREKRQHHQFDVFGERTFDTSQLGGMVARHESGGLRLTPWSRRHQSRNGEDRVGNYQQVAGHQSRAIGHR